MSIHIPESHPRALSLKRREQIIEACHSGVVADAGLIAHGRGEAFDYLFGETTPPTAAWSVEAAAARLLLAAHPVLSINGNLAALCPQAVVELAEAAQAAMEINLFYRTPGREDAIKQVLESVGAKKILGLDSTKSRQIPELQSDRRIVDADGIFISDVVLVPLEDGDRTEALVKLGKCVITIDLNPLSRTARKADITIVDDVERAMLHLTEQVRAFRTLDKTALTKIVEDFDNGKNLAAALEFIRKRLADLGRELNN